ncbi:MAG: PAS domain-containing protein [Methanomicrobiales archaeon]|nr:PAS domain-containing protein [Methanomicrobiales archaeon]
MRETKMTTGKKETEEKKPTPPDIECSLRDDAEEKLSRSPKSSPDLKGQTPEQLIHELRVQQVELEMQAEQLRVAQLALAESRDKYLNLYEFAPTGYITLNDKALIEEVNLTGATLLGVDRKKLHNARFRKFIAEKDSEPWVRYFMNVLAQERKQSCTLMIQRGDGSTFLARLESKWITDKSDGAPRVHVAISDISDIRQAEEALRESEVRFRSLFQNMDSLFSLYKVVLDKNGIPCDYRFLELNPSYEKFIGMRSSELIGRTLLEVFPLTESYWTDKFKEVYNTGIPSHFENYSKELDTYIELSIYSPQKGQIALISSDITEDVTSCERTFPALC